MYSCYCEPGSYFALNDLYLNTFCHKLKFRKRELILNGKDLEFLKGRRLEDIDLKIICEWLSQHPDVISLDFSYNCFTDRGAHILANFLENCSNITRLNLMCNDIEAEGVKRFTDLGSKLKVQSLRLNGNKIGEEGGKYIASLLQCNSSLIHLDIAETDQNGTSLAYILAALQEHNKSSNLKLLDISRPLGYGYYKYDSHHAMEAIGNMLKFNSIITELHLQKMGIDCSDVPLLILGLKHNKTLMLLDLQANYIGCDGAEALAGWLATSTLRGIMLSHNNIDDLGAIALGYKLASSRIKLLDLAHNKITSKGLLFLVDTLKKVAKLDTLYIWGNKFSDQVCRRIKRMLLSGVLTQNNLDVKIYEVDGVNHPAFHSVDRSKHIYYCVGDYGFPQPLGISKPHENLIPTEILHQSLTRKHRGRRICPQGVKMIDDQEDHSSLDIPTSLDCRTSSLITVESKIGGQDIQDESFSTSLEPVEYRSMLAYLKSKKIKDLIEVMKIKKQLEMKELCNKHIKSTIARIIQRMHKLHEEKENAKHLTTGSSGDISMDMEGIAEAEMDFEELGETESVQVQTSLPVLRSQHFSYELRTSYPLTSYSIAEMELAKKNKIEILDEVQEAYIRKYEQPNILREESYDSCNDPYYSINNDPFIITHSLEDKTPVEEEPEEEVQEEVFLVAEAESVKSEKEQYLQPRFSTYEIRELHIHGVPVKTPLSKDAKEALIRTQEESTSSESFEEEGEQELFCYYHTDNATQTDPLVKVLSMI